MGLFNSGDFTLHSGQRSNFLIDCNALSEDDLNALAKEALKILPWGFGSVIGVPRGGLRFAAAMAKHCRRDVGHVLIADDVYTTGASIRAIRDERCQGYNVVGIVIFARQPVKDDWIKALFTMTGGNL